MRAGWALLLLLPLWASLHAQTPLTARDAVALRYPTQAVISPDGSKAVLSVREADFAGRRFVSHLWLATAMGDSLRQFTTGDGSDWAPSWSPDGEFIAFLSDRSLGGRAPSAERTMRLWLIPASGGEAVCVSGLEEVVAYRWSPVGRRLYYVARQRSATHEGDPIVFRPAGAPDELWAVDPPDGTPRWVADLGPGVSEIDVSPEERWVAFSTKADATGRKSISSVKLLDLSTGETREATLSGLSLSCPRFSPDGLSLACLTPAQPEVVCSQSELVSVDLVTSRLTWLTKQLDFAVSDPVWAPDGRSVYVRVAVRTNTYVYQVYLDGKRITSLLRDVGVTGSLSVAADGQTIAYLHEDAQTLPELFFRSKAKEQKLTDFSSQLAQFSLGNQAVIRYQNEGHELEMVVVYPVGYVPGLRCPVILFVHDGPYDRFVNAFRQKFLFQVFANRGYLVAAPNQRGSAGYTNDFAQASRLDIGGGDYRDLMAAVMYLDDLGVGDFARMGIIGLGYGGYMVNWAVTQTDRFRAAVSLSGVFNLTCTGGGPERDAWNLTYLGTHCWLDSKPYVERSPLFYARFIETPVLLLQGEQDRVADGEHAEEMARILTALGKNVDLVVYPREGHCLDSDPEHVVDWMERILAWFDRHVLTAASSGDAAGKEP
ncbi:MAG: S9 family peptidase [candidate division KSB1 bacterium]|nr:S9 family peptidase [candidate division KSB1 bacterium]